jgi:hypothetical protein
VTGFRRRRESRTIAALLALLLSIQAIAWVAHSVTHVERLQQADAWRASPSTLVQVPAEGLADGAVPAGASATAEAPHAAHAHGGPFARCGACDALAELQGGALPWQPPVPTTLSSEPAPSGRGAAPVHRFLARATARGPPPG